MKKIKFLLVLVCLTVLAGCGTLYTHVATVPVKVGKKGHRHTITYVLFSGGNAWCDGAMTCDRYNGKGDLIAHDFSNESGPLSEALGQAAAGAFSLGTLTGLLQALGGSSTTVITGK